MEKPDAATASALAAREDMFWNSCIFIIPVGAGLVAARAASPALAAFLDALPAPATARHAGDAGRPALAAAFAAVHSSPFDVEVMEQTPRRLMLPLADAGWSDLGSWGAIWEGGEPDADGNVLGDTALAIDSRGCLVASDGPDVAALGVRDLVIVAWGGGVLVCPRDRAQEVKSIVEKLP
jgi:mannose-1-phosphate guanylyltransferase/mannose-1-phosphate guanylyltransferase/mannose-6-phosphate isomerase